MPTFQKGAQFPPASEIERIAKYRRGRKTFDGKVYELYERASDILKDTPHASQLEKLYIAVNIIEVLLYKPADLLTGEAPSFETGKPDSSPEQKALNRIVEENDLIQLIHEIAVSGGYRGDSFIKERFGYRQDFSALPEGAEIPDSVQMEPIIEAVNPSYVIPELARGNRKKFRAVNICTIEYVPTRDEEVPFLNVERHTPGYIIYERYRLHEFEGGVDASYGVPIQVFEVGEQVATGRDEDVIPTGVPNILVDHIPRKSIDEEWQGISDIEKMESVLSAINDRLVQLDYILFKHSDPTLFGPDLEGSNDQSVRLGGKYLPITKDDPTPGAITWNGHLDYVFRELDMLIGIVFTTMETPQWLMGTTFVEDKGGTGTSHTDGAAIRARFMPILSKVTRIRGHIDKAIRDALYKAQLLEVEQMDGVDGFESYEPTYPTINWRDSLPKNFKEEAEIMQIRTGNRPTIDSQSAIKRMDDVDDEKAKEIMDRIEDAEKADSLVEPSIFNE